MSSAIETTLESTNITIQQQSVAATQELCEALGLGVLKPAELKYLTVALARGATEEAQRNDEFKQHIQSLYQSLLPVKPTKAKAPKKEPSSGARSSGSKKVKLTPIGSVDESELNPYAPPNPWALRRLYGDKQLSAALGRYSADKLKETLPAMQQRYPGTQPKKMTKPGIIAYIVEMLTSADTRPLPPSQ